MVKALTFTSELASLDEAHAAGGCALPNNMMWPTDLVGKPQLHLITIPLSWVVPRSVGWISVFTPYDVSDTYLHWESLAVGEENLSAVIVHDNSGQHRNEYPNELSAAKKILLEEDSIPDSDKNLASKIYGVPAWLQDVDVVSDHQCVLAINGEDVDIGFPEEPGIFSDGLVYVFLQDGFQACTKPSRQGVITFQFS